MYVLSTTNRKKTTVKGKSGPGGSFGSPGRHSDFIAYNIIIDGLLCRTGTDEQPQLRLCIPTKMIRTVLSETHGNRTSHFGQKKTLWRGCQHFYWRGMYSDLTQYVQTCPECQLRKPPHTNERGIMGTTELGTDVIHTISCDIVTLPRTRRGNQYALTAIDQISKFAFAIPLKRQDEDTVTRKLKKHIFQKFGAPEILITDQGTNFMSRKAKHLYQQFGVTHRTTVPHHPQSNGECERLNQTLAIQLAIMGQSRQRDWDVEIDNVTYQYNSTIHRSTGYPPLQILIGKRPGLPLVKQFGLNPIIGIEDIKTIREKTLENLRRNQQYNQNIINRHPSTITYKIGEQVLLERSAILISKNAKLKTHWEGPYEITKISCPQNVTLKYNRRYCYNGVVILTYYNLLHLRWENNQPDIITITLSSLFSHQRDDQLIIQINIRTMSIESIEIPPVWREQ